jgi:hypothetical protein
LGCFAREHSVDDLDETAGFTAGGVTLVDVIGHGTPIVSFVLPDRCRAA